MGISEQKKTRQKTIAVCKKLQEDGRIIIDQGEAIV
mgnify:CR=1 FL=1|jgi:hypothetical protein